MGECNKNKRKTHEERWHVTVMTGGDQVVPAPTDLELNVLLVIGSESIDGFDGWMDTGIAWRYDWHQRPINRAYHCSETG